MKNTLLFLSLLLLVNTTIYSQNFTELADYKFDKTEDYTTAESLVIESANFLFNNPADNDKLNRLSAVQFIMKWMEGTADYTFSIGANVMDLTKGNSDLLGLYLAAMSKTALENKQPKLNDSEISESAKNILVDYCANTANNIKPSKAIKKIIKQKNK